MVWGAQPWIKDLPYANAACKYSFKHGESGKLVLEFFVTPFDYAPPDSSRAVPSKLVEDKVIGMSWAILDYDDEKAERYGGFWNLSHKTTMYGDASDLVAFPIDAHREISAQVSRGRLVFPGSQPGAIALWHSVIVPTAR